MKFLISFRITVKKKKKKQKAKKKLNPAVVVCVIRQVKEEEVPHQTCITANN